MGFLKIGIVGREIIRFFIPISIFCKLLIEKGRINLMNTKVSIKPRIHIGTLFVVLFSMAVALTAITEVTITTYE